MKKIINHIRNQSEETKTHILHFLTILFGFGLLILWTYSLGTTLSEEGTQTKIKEDLKPFSVLKDNVIPEW